MISLPAVRGQTTPEVPTRANKRYQTSLGEIILVGVLITSPQHTIVLSSSLHSKLKPEQL